MAQLYLPIEHTEADLVLAGQIAEWIESDELYVTWTAVHGHSVPQVAAELRYHLPSWPSLLLSAVRELCAVFRRREPAQRLSPPPRPAELPETA